MSDQGNVTGSPRAPLVIASSARPVLVQSTGAEVSLVIDRSAISLLASEQATYAGDASDFHVYLVLDRVRGTQDATVLQAYLRNPDAAQAGQPADVYLDSIALFGLRRASSGALSEGMQFYVDITPHAALLHSPTFLADGQILVSIRPQKTLADTVSIDIGQVSICAEKPTPLRQPAAKP
jgi:hypothetical protein